MAETFLYLTTKGWKTGNPHKIEIWFVEDRGSYFIVAEKRDNAHWIQNIQHDSEVMYYVAEQGANPPTANHGHARILDETKDAELIAVVQTMMAEKYNWGDGTVVCIEPD